jgi:hypothetical protein
MIKKRKKKMSGHGEFSDRWQEGAGRNMTARRRQ